MVSLEKAVRARLETHGHKFEILVDPDAALKFRSSAGKEVFSAATSRIDRPCS